MTIELPQGYYLSNFLELIHSVFEQYADLLSEAEINFFHHFKTLQEPAQMLYVRMLTRKGEVFRISKLEYREIPDTMQTAQQLLSNGFVDIDTPFDIESIIGLFNKSEWLHMLNKLELDSETSQSIKRLKRPELDSIILNLNQEFDVSSLLDEPLIKIKHPEIFETYKLLFFGNANQDLTDFVLRDLGLFRFEKYVIHKDVRLFSSREQIDCYIGFYQLLLQLEDVLAGDSSQIVQFHIALPTAQDDRILSRRVQRINLTLARQLERLDALDEALAIYQQCRLPPARERRARILVKQQKIEAALALCERMLQNPMDESEAIFANDFAYRSARKYKIDWQKPVNYLPPTEKIALTQSGLGVEQDSADFLNQHGKCFFVENALFLSVFGLHFWELIFAPVRGAFTNPFQVRPHDLYDEDFISNRQTLFEQLDSQLKDLSQNVADYLRLRDNKLGTATPFVFWDIVDENLIQLALQRIPAEHWQKIFARLWQDLRANRSGFPDLIFFPDVGGYQLVEIKGPGDRLQKNQIRWMQYFAEHNIPHKVVHVEWQLDGIGENQD